MLAGPVPVQRRAAFNCHRSILTPNKLTVFKEGDGDTVEIDAGLVESAEFNLARSRGMYLQLSTLKVAVVKLNMARGCLWGKE